MSSAERAWPKTTVIIVNWNCERFLDRCLSALSAQTVAPHEIILVDNASSDASLEVARRYAGVRLLPQSKNLGFAEGNNLAILDADPASEWIALLNPDAFPDPRWLEELLIAAREHPRFDSFGSKLINSENPNILDGAGDAYHISGQVWRLGQNRSSAFGSEKKEIFSPCAAAALYRLSALTKVGSFDGDYFCYIEDIDLGFRLQLAGYRCLYVPSSIAYHIGSGATGGQHSDFAVYHGHRNLVWTFIKNMPGALFWLFLPLHIAMNLAAVAVVAWRGQARVILLAKWHALKGISQMWKKRQRIQHERQVSAFSMLRVMKVSLDK